MLHVQRTSLQNQKCARQTSNFLFLRDEEPKWKLHHVASLGWARSIPGSATWCSVVSSSQIFLFLDEVSLHQGTWITLPLANCGSKEEACLLALGYKIFASHKSHEIWDHWARYGWTSSGARRAKSQQEAQWPLSELAASIAHEFMILPLKVPG